MCSALAAVALVLLVAQTSASGCGNDPEPAPAAPAAPAARHLATCSPRRTASAFASKPSPPTSTFPGRWRLRRTAGSSSPSGRDACASWTSSTRTSELALTLDDVFAQGEAGALGLALDPALRRTASRLPVLLGTSSGGARSTASCATARRAAAWANASCCSTASRRTQFTTAAGSGSARTACLYVTAGDAANAGLAQDLASPAGKILRLNRDGTTPRSNPFSSPVYSYGHRNPQGLDWHPATGDLWASEHGNSGNDEINVIDAGANYGWPRIEGAQTMAGMRTPIAFYNPAIAPSGASFYRGQLFRAVRQQPVRRRRFAARTSCGCAWNRAHGASPRRNACSRTSMDASATWSPDPTASCISRRTTRRGGSDRDRRPHRANGAGVVAGRP